VAGPILSAVVLGVLSAGAIAFFYSQGCLLYYGDATAHINVARRILDSRTPGWEQVGTVWLPLPHLLMVPFVGFDTLWMTGLAGSIPCGFCFVLAGVLLFLSARRVFADGIAAATACLLLALNPNLLYLQAIPMTEALFLACVAALLYATVRFRETQSWGAVVAAGACVAVAAGPQAVSEKAAITSRTNILKAKLLVRISSNLLYGYYDFLSGTLFGRKDLLEHFRSNVPCTPPIIEYSNAFMTPRCGMAVNNHEVLQQP